MTSRHRSQTGNMLAMIAATAMLLVACLLFGLQYLSVNRGHMEQRTAAEAAALAAAADIGRIAVNTKEFGWVGLSAVGPVASTTAAPDHWYCEVKSINEIVGTLRLDYIIADQMNDPFMKALALADYQKTQSAVDQLETAIKASLVAGGSASDVFGHKITAYDDAKVAYINNNAKQSTYVDDSLTLSLGCLSTGVATAIVVPTPTTKASVNPNQVAGNVYMSDIDLPFNSQDFYLASSGAQVALVDITKFQAPTQGQIAAIVKIEADNQFSNQGQTYTQHFIAAAMPGSDVKRPADGALTISFPDGPPPELTAPIDLTNGAWKQLAAAQCDILTSANGDYPIDSGSNISNNIPSSWVPITWSGGTPNAQDVCRVGIYDFLREAGSGVNIDSVLAMLKAKFNPPSPLTTVWKAPDPGLPLSIISVGSIPTGIAHIYTINADGTILYRSKTITPYPYTIAADSQLYSESTSATGSGIVSSVAGWTLSSSMTLPDLSGPNPPGSTPPPGGGKGGKGNPAPTPAVPQPTFSLQTVNIAGLQQYDLYMRDMVHQQGTVGGGNHAGEPMDNPLVAQRKIDKKLSEIAMIPSDSYEVGGGSVAGVLAGLGIPPVVSRQDDFASTSPPPASGPMYYQYVNGPDASGSFNRPTYSKNGMSVDIRFRRQVDIGLLSILFGGFRTGYIGEMD